MSFVLISLALGADLERPVLGQYAPQPRALWLHGPDGPGIPDEGYEYDEPGNGLGWIALGLAAGAGGTAIAMRQSRLAMEDATCRYDLDQAYTKNKRRGYSTYGLLGGAAVFLGLAIAF
ncbi:MAG TPA: hypothetical protein QGF58_12030 [Myxococcota bacterium]|nr:hypothetical protein [Myxococcota bacterium]